MEKRITTMEKNGILWHYEVNTFSGEIKYSDLQEHWSYANYEQIDGFKVDVIDEKYILGIVLTACGQGGIIFIWDMSQKKIIHMSEGSYAVAALLHEGKVYTLRCVSNYVTRAHFELTSVDQKRMDAWKETDEVKGTDISHLVRFYNGNLSSLIFPVKVSGGDRRIQIMMDRSFLRI